MNRRPGEVIPTACTSLDRLLGGGFPRGKVSLIYGEAASGKTAIALQCAMNCAKGGSSVVYVDADRSVSPTRLLQLSGYERRLLSSILISRPETFDEQDRVIEELDKRVSSNVPLVVFDTITSLYRLELGSTEETFLLNRRLNYQLARLAQLAKERNSAILLLSQVHGIFREPTIEPVAARLLTFWSDLILRLRSTVKPQVKEAILEKFDRKRRLGRCYFKILEDRLIPLGEV